MNDTYTYTHTYFVYIHIHRHTPLPSSSSSTGTKDTRVRGRSRPHHHHAHHTSAPHPPSTMPPHFPISEGHSQLVKCLMRQLLRDARRIRHSKSPFLFLQARPQKEAYSHLWEINPDHDARILDALLPPYLRHELTTCELKAKVCLCVK